MVEITPKPLQTKTHASEFVESPKQGVTRGLLAIGCELMEKIFFLAICFPKLTTSSSNHPITKYLTTPYNTLRSKAANQAAKAINPKSCSGIIN